MAMLRIDASPQHLFACLRQDASRSLGQSLDPVEVGA